MVAFSTEPSQIPMPLLKKFFTLLTLCFLFNQTTTAQERDFALSAEEVTPLLIGATVPDVELKSIDGKSQKLQELVGQKPTVLIFYRGGWCPYCSRHMMELQKIENEIVELGYQILAVSPDKPEELSKSMVKGELSYTLLSDSPMDVSKAFGIAWKMDDKGVARYLEVGIDLEKSSGYTHHLLPAPAVFIINTEGKIRFTYVNPDYKERINGDVLIAAAKAYLE